MASNYSAPIKNVMNKNRPGSSCSMIHNKKSTSVIKSSGSNTLTSNLLNIIKKNNAGQ